MMKTRAGKEADAGRRARERERRDEAKRFLESGGGDKNRQWGAIIHY